MNRIDDSAYVLAEIICQKIFEDKYDIVSKNEEKIRGDYSEKKVMNRNLRKKQIIQQIDMWSKVVYDMETIYNKSKNSLTPIELSLHFISKHKRDACNERLSEIEENEKHEQNLISLFS